LRLVNQPRYTKCERVKREVGGFRFEEEEIGA